MVLAALGAAAPAQAQYGYRGGRWWHGSGPHFRANFGPWYHGYWHRGMRFGRPGWWWVVGSTWYPYAAPIYPYPDPYIPSTVIVPPPVMAPPAPAPLGPPPPQYWYYCAPANTYYPYVSHCSTDWQKVPATPPPPPESQP